ncbi:hypothetical protein ABZ749_01040 [Micromonospora sp. NPDC047753]|uniref:hypothetical protein n=1 Tax=Micromonospora sp. NPDC047753 TaxID=3154817 RepID=UPI0033F6BE05
MSEQQGAQNGGQQDGSTPPEPRPFTPITSQDDLNRVIAERVARERGKFADYNDLKAKAGRLDEIEQANKSEIEKANDRVTKAEAEAAKVPSLVAGQLREHLVKLHGISDEDAELFLTASDPELLLKQVDRLVGRGSQRKKTGNHVPREGSNPNSGSNSDMREFTRRLFDVD